MLSIILSIIVMIAIISFYFYKRKNNYIVSVEQTESYNDLPTLEIANVLSIKERLELSWEPLKKIAELVISKFSSQDQNKLIEIGTILIKHGARYIHVVDYSAPKVSYAKKTISNPETQVDKKSISR